MVQSAQLNVEDFEMDIAVLRQRLNYSHICVLETVAHLDIAGTPTTIKNIAEEIGWDILHARQVCTEVAEMGIVDAQLPEESSGTRLTTRRK